MIAIVREQICAFSKSEPLYAADGAPMAWMAALDSCNCRGLVSLTIFEYVSGIDIGVD
jgi:hypothetical protein